MRETLAGALGCNEMRIIKKFAGGNNLFGAGKINNKFSPCAPEADFAEELLKLGRLQGEFRAALAKKDPSKKRKADSSGGGKRAKAVVTDTGPAALAAGGVAITSTA